MILITFCFHMGYNTLIEITFTDPPTVIVSPVEIRRESENVELTCHVIYGNPTETTKSWLLPDGSEFNNDTLELTGLTPDMAGNYTCVVKNSYYNGEEGTGRNTTYLDVQCKFCRNNRYRYLNIYEH